MNCRWGLIGMLMLFTAWSVQGQYGNERTMWYFGDQAALDFSQGFPVAVSNSAMLAPEGCATVSDNDGNLLFYTNGTQVWNRQHRLMPGGSGLNGNVSSAQSCLVLKLPGSSSVYYIFTTSAMEDNGADGLRYSVVNMQLDNGMGDVEAGSKNTLLFAPCMEMLSTVRHANGTDFWVVAREVKGNGFRAYLFSASGVGVSGMVRSPDVNTVVRTRFGMLRFSRDATKMASTYADLNAVGLYDFNRSTGTISHRCNLNMNLPYSVCFSPNSRFLYASPPVGPGVMQFDTWLSNTEMNNFALTVRFSGPPPYRLGALQPGPFNDDIYVARSGSNRISRIPSPNLIAPDCGVIDSIGLSSRGMSTSGLPNYPASDINADGFLYRNPCAGQPSAFFALNVRSMDSITWVFGDGNKRTTYPPFDTVYYTYGQAGQYFVSGFCYQAGAVDHAFPGRPVTIYASPDLTSLGPDQVICKDQQVTLAANTSMPNKWVWSDGSTDPYLIATKPGLYWVRAYNNYCSVTDSIHISINPKTFPVSLGPDTFLCPGETRLLDAGYTDAVYKWQDGSSNRTFLADRSQTYTVEVVRPGFVCPEHASVRITFVPFPVLGLGSDRTLCVGDSMLVDMRGNGYAAIQWQDGSHDSLYRIHATGMYHVAVSNGHCWSHDTVEVTIHHVATPSLQPYDLCAGDSVKIDFPNFNGTVTWPDGKTASSRFLLASGNYRLVFRDSICSAEENIVINLRYPPVIDLPADTALCEGEELVLHPGGAAADQYHWQDGSEKPEFTVNHWGVYTVHVQNQCGVRSDSVEVYDCNCHLYVPTAFTPNEDGNNEGFRAEGCTPNVYHLMVFNRWGELVYESHSSAETWDGTFRGKAVAQDVFAWVLEYAYNTRSDSANRTMRGTVTLLR